jgi:DNA-binding beta-propeller fold protein YncE
MYVSDGYGASRMHKFSAEGELLLSWGTEGEGPGQFNMPHGVHVDEAGQVFVADRENNRIQVFTPDGDFISQSTGFAQPCNLAMTQDAVYVAELGHRLSILDRDWQVLAQWDGEADQTKDLFRSPHDVCTDSHGNLYVSEVLKGSRVQKFLRR